MDKRKWPTATAICAFCAVCLPIAFAISAQNERTSLAGATEASSPESQNAALQPQQSIASESFPAQQEPDLQESAVEAMVVDGIILVNKTYALPADYYPGEDALAAARLQEMIATARKEIGRDITMVSGFRSYGYQKELYEKYVQRDGEELASTYSARPGHSEHQTGLAFDLGGEDQEYWLEASFADTFEGQWLIKNAHRFGFILRYPEGKADITGYRYEPWHFRYIGEEHALQVYQDGLTLEEYLFS
jgi:D-alanyl-D-alanine carboxypeptidase